MLRQCRDVCTADRQAIAKLVGALGVPLDQNAMRLAIENGHIHIARRLLESVGGDNNSEKVVVVAAAYQQAVKHRSIDLIRILIWRWNQPLSVGIASMLLDYLVRHSTTAEVDEAFAMAEKQIELDKNFYLPSQIFAAVVDNTDPAEAVSIIRLLTDKYGLIVATGKNGGWAALRKASTKGIDYYTIVVELISHLSVDTNGLQGLALYSITGTTSGTMSDARFAVCNQILMDYGSAIAGDKLTVGGLLRRAIGDSNIEGVFAITRHPSINSCILVEALDSLPLLINDDRIRKEEGQVYIIQDVRLRSLLRRQFNDGAAFKSIDADVEGDDDRSSSSKSAAAILNYLESCLRLPDNKDSP
jgi:hypothetical protein